MRSCIMLGLPTHLVQELNPDTVQVKNNETWQRDNKTDSYGREVKIGFTFIFAVTVGTTLPRIP